MIAGCSASWFGNLRRSTMTEILRFTEAMPLWGFALQKRFPASRCV
ncbi:hypothetical protein RMSM_06969 [Rhodopirellula maiorica SM1]|uniref:Uncharacterized protein n=1 Tax=Rhodopirellula maiorica SM1 TaxID=1265738 RepID=M5R9P9_9BACT|nr:hypothetical protein RMSM_06969 [Rhodopirellula maiorica SM1]